MQPLLNEISFQPGPLASHRKKERQETNPRRDYLSWRSNRELLRKF